MPTLAHIVRRYGTGDDSNSTGRLSAVQQRALRAIARCRTAELGGHIAQCDACGERQYRYHSCRNRACPQCQTLAKERWLAARRAELLPVPYFHLVFTLPHELNALAQGNPRAIYNLLFAAVSKTLIEFGRNPRWLGGQIAASLLLHTWNQVLLQHLHLHCLVAGGALGADGQWISPRGGFLFPTHALSAVFRGKFLERLGALLANGQLKLAGSTAVLAQPSAQRRFLATLRRHDWVVYAKRTLAGPQAVLDYLGRYTTKTALSNHRLLGLDDQGDVRFSWRDRAHGNRRRIMQLPAVQFLERFLARTCSRPGWCASATSGCWPIVTSASSSPRRAPRWPCPRPPPSQRSPPSSSVCGCWASTSSAAPTAGSGAFASWRRSPRRTFHTTRARHEPSCLAHDPTRLNRPSPRARHACAPAPPIDLGIPLCHSERHRNCALLPSCQAPTRPPIRPHRLRASSPASLCAFQSPYSRALSTAVQFN